MCVYGILAVISALLPKADIDPMNAGLLYCLSEAGHRSTLAACL